jgi:hypothetical protein
MPVAGAGARVAVVVAMRVALLLVLAACERAEPASAVSLALPDAPEGTAMRSATAAREPEVEDFDPIIELDPALREDQPPARVGRDLVGLRLPVKRWFLSLSAEDRHIARAACRLRRASPCWEIRELVPRARREVSAFRPFGNNDNLDELCRRTTGDAACATPLVVAFENEPIAYLPATHRFAFRGEPLATDWPTATTPWIAIDRDGDGAITSGFELFGDATAKNGFAALDALDANGDGVIDRADPEFAKLLLWSDGNGDRKSTPDELRPLASAVVAIPLAHRLDPRCVDGNCEGERGVAQLVGGRTGAVIDIYLAER